jgi:hypothetical protein
VYGEVYSRWFRMEPSSQEAKRLGISTAKLLDRSGVHHSSNQTRPPILGFQLAAAKPSSGLSPCASPASHAART